ncbi:unnamed protein product [Auanema sp. JU1783]|nr:unnamed protein product [Auanema sp. JU1783]
MTTSVNSVVSVFQNFFSNHGSILLNGILIVSTIGGQSLIRKLTFACPCAFPLNIYHSIVFMFGPTIALLLIGIMINTTTWKLAHGCCFRVPETRHSWKTVCVYWVELIVQSLIAPTAWLFVVLLDGGYYRCLLAHGYCDINKSNFCKNETIMVYYRDSLTFDSVSGNGKFCPECICKLDGHDGSFLEAESQIMAWFLVIFVGLSALCILCLTRMCDKYTLVQRNYVELYKEEEKFKFDSVAKEYASQLAERNARAFFNQTDWSKKDWDWVSGVSEVNNPMFARLRLIASEKTNTTFYTPLQLWSSHKGYRILKPEVLQCSDDIPTGVVVVEPQNIHKTE